MTDRNSERVLSQMNVISTMLLLCIVCVLTEPLFAQIPGDYDPSFDMSVGANGTVYAVMALDDGKLLIGGDFTTIQGASVPYLARLNSDGTVDNTFDTGTGPNGPVYCMLPYSSDKYLVAGDFTEYDGITVSRMVALNNDGSRYTLFQSVFNVNAAIRCMEYSTTGILVGGAFSTPTSGIGKIGMSGLQDITFNTNTGLGTTGGIATVYDIYDGPTYIMIAGSFNAFDGNTAPNVARLFPDGTYDTFSNNSGSGTNSSILHIEPVPGVGDPLILSGAFSTYDGNAVSGAVKVAEELSYQEPASQGIGFVGSPATVTKVLRQPDGKLIALGYFTHYDSNLSPGIVRLNSDFSFDPSFDPGIGFNGASSVAAIARQWDGRYLVGGTFSSYDGNTANNLVRIYGDHCFSRLMGSVTLGGQPISDGKVYVYTEQVQGVGYSIVDSTDITNGEYIFESLAEFPVTYILQAVPDPQVYPPNVAVPTFFSPDGPSHEWNNPLLTYSLNSTCGNIDTINITVLAPEAGIVSPGTGSISGQLRWAENKRPVEDPIPIIDVVVEKLPPGNAAFAYTQTDLDGNYIFSDLPLTAGQNFVYGIHVSIPGIPMQNTYFVSIEEENLTLENLDFLCDTVENIIYPVGAINVGIDALTDRKLSVYPSPMTDRLTIEVPSSIIGSLKLEIFDSNGRLHRVSDHAPSPTITILRNDLSAGKYMLRLSTETGLSYYAAFVVTN
ncbi:MAG: T9SS type A sorting domain-containing protein [Bacteroidetes bacterium]|nr:MAG: T9SS type A sorting domain-containing protein [Bacteroidota bacterium]